MSLLSTPTLDFFLVPKLRALGTHEWAESCASRCGAASVHGTEAAYAVAASTPNVLIGKVDSHASKALSENCSSIRSRPSVSRRLFGVQNSAERRVGKGALLEFRSVRFGTPVFNLVANLETGGESSLGRGEDESETFAQGGWRGREATIHRRGRRRRDRAGGRGLCRGTRRVTFGYFASFFAVQSRD